MQSVTALAVAMQPIIPNRQLIIKSAILSFISSHVKYPTFVGLNFCEKLQNNISMILTFFYFTVSK